MSKVIQNIYKICLLREEAKQGKTLTAVDLLNLKKCEKNLHGALGRKHLRTKSKFPAYVRKNGKEILVQVQDLSPGGMRIVGANELSSGDKVSIHLREDNAKSYLFRARVIWKANIGEDELAGLCFDGMPNCLEQEKVSNELVKRKTHKVAS